MSQPNDAVKRDKLVEVSKHLYHKIAMLRRNLECPTSTTHGGTQECLTLVTHPSITLRFPAAHGIPDIHVIQGNV